MTEIQSPPARIDVPNAAWPCNRGPERVIIVDDDPGIREVVGDFLLDQGFAVDLAANGPQMDRHLAHRPADLVLLDLMLPGEDGLSLCRRLARPGGPAIILFSALDDAVDRIVGWEVGADHYLAKPCAPRELLAWVRAVLRRRRGGADDRRATPAFAFEGWRLDPILRSLASPDGTIVSVPPRLFDLLRLFVEHPRSVISLGAIAALDPRGDVSDDAGHRRIGRLREVLGRGSNGTEFIRTLRGEGYVFTASVTRTA